jgi:anthranilate synthase component 1
MNMTLDQFNQLVDTHRRAPDQKTVVPVYKRLSADLLTPVSAFLTLRRPGELAFLLESVEGGEELGRYSFLGQSPYRIVEGHGETVTVHTDNNRSIQRDENIFEVMQQLLDEYEELPVPELPRLRGGAVGFLGYDAVRLVEDLPDSPADDLNLPDAVWGFYDTIVAFDHVKHQVILVANAFLDAETRPDAAYKEAQKRITQLEQQLSRGIGKLPEPVSLTNGQVSSNMKRRTFEQAVEQAREYIYEGDIFQVVLSQRFDMEFEGNRFNLYRALRQVNPSPYLFYLDFDEFSLVGSSPEVLVRVENDTAELLPIAGTRPRGETPEEDEALAEDLLNDPKERAEHVMLVDLGRNDLGRVCTYDTVTVDRYAYIEKYSHVMHIVSSVSGELDDQFGAMDVLAACFPAGTVSGAPKVRAMEIIDELEPTRRSVYAGAVGYVDFSGTLDTCITIRTMLVKENRVYVQAGAGIVADSDPGREFEETVNKAEALQEAVKVAANDLL